MRKWVVWLHTYGLLLCAAYLLMLGVSTLVINHRNGEPASGDVVSWQKTIPSPPSGTDQQRAESVRDQLGLMGWVPTWNIRHDADDTLKFNLTRPGKDYSMRLSPDGKTVSVDEKRRGIAPVLHAMHGMMKVPGSMLAAAYGWYTRLCIVALLIATVSGIYMFATRGTERRVGLVLALAGFVTATGAIFYLSFFA